jgi:hypothetical protein
MCRVHLGVYDLEVDYRLLLHSVKFLFGDQAYRQVIGSLRNDQWPGVHVHVIKRELRLFEEIVVFCVVAAFIVEGNVGQLYLN